MATSHVNDLFKAISKRDAERARALLDSYPLLAGARNQSGVSALMLARYMNLRAVTDAILAHNPELDIFEAATFGQVERLRQLLAGDAALAKVRSADGGTALHFACFFAHPECAHELIRHGSDLKAVAPAFGNVTPLHSAAAGHDAEIVGMLLEAGAEPNAKQNLGWTALHSAAHNGDAAMVQVLLEHGADPAMKADNGETPVDLAQKNGHGEVVRLLQEKAPR